MTTALFSNAATEDEVTELTTLYALDEKKVRTWDRVKVAVMLDAHRRADRITRSRAARTAEGQDDDRPSRGQPSQLERQIAADFLASAVDGDPDELVCALLHVGHAVRDDEARRLASELIRMFRGDDAERRAPAPEGFGVRLSRERDGGREPDACEIPD